MKNVFIQVIKRALILLALVIIAGNANAKNWPNTTVDTGKTSVKPEFYKFFMNTLSYPAHAKSNNIQGYVAITFTVENNKINDIKIIEEPEKGFGEIVTSVFKDINKDKNTKLLNSLQPGKYAMNFRFALASVAANKQIFVPEKQAGYTNLNEVVIVASGMRTQTNP